MARLYCRTVLAVHKDLPYIAGRTLKQLKLLALAIRYGKIWLTRSRRRNELRRCYRIPGCNARVVGQLGEVLESARPDAKREVGTVTPNVAEAS